MEYVLKTTDLTKVINENEIIKNVSINVKKGEIYALLGPNGAGKTTIMKMITTLIKPSCGEIKIFDKVLYNNSYEMLKRIGAIIEYPVFYDKLTARENLELHLEYMGYHNKEEIDRVLELVKLKGVNTKKVREFSLGMKQRLGIARAIVTKPELLILDEPINGLDPEGIREIRELLKLLSREYKMTVLLSSHILGEIEQIADTIGVISQGKLIKEVSMDEIKEIGSHYIEIETDNLKVAGVILENNLKIKNFKFVDGNKIRIYDSVVTKKEISKALVLGNISVEGIREKSGSLEEYFLKLTKGEKINA